MKLGRIGKKELDDLMSRLKKVLSRKPSHSVAFVLAPVLVSEKTPHGNVRGEIRTSYHDVLFHVCLEASRLKPMFLRENIGVLDRFTPATCRRCEDKMDAKNLSSISITVRCNPPPAQKKVPISYNAWLVFCEGSEEESIWKTSQLLLDRLLDTKSSETS